MTALAAVVLASLAESATVTRGLGPCSAARPPFCSAQGPRLQQNWSCPHRRAFPDPCDVCYHSACAGCTQCTGALPPPPPSPLSPTAPADWQPRVNAAQMFFSNGEIRAGFTPALGNGFMSGDAGCCTMHCQDCAKGNCRDCHSVCTSPSDSTAFGSVELSGCGRLHLAGVFNGALGNAIGPGEPNRASISNPHSVYVKDVLEWVGGALDVERGTFHNRTRVRCPEDGDNATITLTMYHHRHHRNLQVLEISGPARPCTVRLGNCSLNSEELDFNITTVSGGGRRLEILAMEQPNTPPHWQSTATNSAGAETRPISPPGCTSVPQPCPGHPGRTWCPSDPIPHQCDKPSHGPCPQCKAEPRCSTLPPPFCNSGNKADHRVFSCGGCGSCLNCPNCTVCSGPASLTPTCEWPNPPNLCVCLHNATSCNADPSCGWVGAADDDNEGGQEQGSCKPKGWLPATVVGAAASTVPHTITFATNDSTRSYLAVYRTSLEPGITRATAAETAVADLKRYSAMDLRSLEKSHLAAWASLWESGVEVSGNRTVASTINVTFYAILSSLREDTPLGCSPSGLARNNYEGHSFWDCETWILPSIVLQWPGIAESMNEYRYNRLHPAQERAKQRGLAGAMWPWESVRTMQFACMIAEKLNLTDVPAPGYFVWREQALSGYDMCGPGQTEGTNEIHISGDIPMAFRLTYLINQNQSWLRTVAWPVVRDSANFFASRAERDPVSGNYTQKQVVTPDEGAGIVDDAAYTNAIAARTMQFACMVAEKLNLTDVPAPGYFVWREQAARPYLPLSSRLDPNGPIHPEFTNYSGFPIAQSAVALMQYPLGWPMGRDLAMRDLAYYQVRSSGPTTAGFFTGDSSYSIAWLRVGNRTQADDQFAQAFFHLDLDGYGVWMEKWYSHSDGGALNEISSGGAFLQNVLYGYAGVSIEAKGLIFDPGLQSHQQVPGPFPLTLPMGMSGMVLRGIAFAGYQMRYEFNATNMSFKVTRAPPTKDSSQRQTGMLCVILATGRTQALDLLVPLVLPLQRVLVHLAAVQC